MSKLNAISNQSPPNFLFPADKVPSNGLELEERQKLAKLIRDIGLKLCVPEQCIYAAIVYMHRFLIIQSSAQYYLLRLCQASIFLACKSQESIRLAKDVYESTAKVLKIEISNLSDVIDSHKNAILDYEDLLISTLGFGIAVRYPHECIIEAIGKIRDRTRSPITKLLDEITNIACYLMKQSILFTSFCVKYSADLIACFCIQLSIEIKGDQVKSTDWMNKSFTREKIQILIDEFCVIYKKYSDNQKFLNEEEYKLYKIVHKKALFYVDLLERKSVSPALIKERGSHILSTSDTVEPKSSVPLSPLSSAIPPSSYDSFDSYRHMEGGISSTNQTSRSLQRPVKPDTDPKFVQADASTGNKRRYDSTNDETACKRSSSSSSSLQQRKK